MIDKPIRVQLRRTKGWRMPPNTIKVDRSTRFGNSFAVGTRYAKNGRMVLVDTVETAVDLFRQRDAKLIVRKYMNELRGKNLACWCALNKPCHADVLLELVNTPIHGV